MWTFFWMQCIHKMIWDIRLAVFAAAAEAEHSGWQRRWESLLVWPQMLAESTWPGEEGQPTDTGNRLEHSTGSQQQRQPSTAAAVVRRQGTLAVASRQLCTTITTGHAKNQLPLNFSAPSSLAAANSVLSNLTDNSESNRKTKNRHCMLR